MMAINSSHLPTARTDQLPTIHTHLSASRPKDSHSTPPLLMNGKAKVSRTMAKTHSSMATSSKSSMIMEESQVMRPQQHPQAHGK